MEGNHSLEEKAAFRLPGQYLFLGTQQKFRDATFPLKGLLKDSLLKFRSQRIP